MFSNPKNILGFDDRILALCGVVVNTHTVMGIYYTGSFFEVPFKDYAKVWFGEFLAIVILWVVLRSLYLQLLKKNKGVKNQKKRFLAIILFLIPLFLICLLYIDFVQPLFVWDYEQYATPSVAVQLVTGTVIFLVDMGLYEGLHIFVELKNAKLREAQLKKENVTSQLYYLRSQVSPHFLFNSLNTLMHLIDEDKEKSKIFVHSLAKIYARILEFSEKDLVSVQEELDYINEYMALLKKRHGENLSYQLKVSPSCMNKMIVPLSVQMGIENAIKHNVISKKNPLKISIKNIDNYVVIGNNLQKKKNPTKKEGYGLANIRNRYKLLSKAELVIEETKSQFNLMLPLLEVETH